MDKVNTKKDKRIAKLASGLISCTSLLILTSIDTSIKPRENIPTTFNKVKIIELNQEEPKPKVEHKKEVKKQKKEQSKKILKSESKTTRNPLEEINEPEPISKIVEKVESTPEKKDVIQVTQDIAKTDKQETQTVAKEVSAESKEQDKGTKKEDSRVSSPPPPPPQNVRPGDLDILSLYLSKVKSIVERKKRYPEEAKRFGVVGKVSVRITVDKEGSIRSFSIVKSSGSRILDQETLALIKSIGRFPEPPGGKELTFVLTIDYQLEE